MSPGKIPFRRIPFLDLGAQYREIREEIDAAVLRVLDSGWYILGKECEAFEQAFATYLSGDTPGYVIGVNSGTDALKLSLLAAGVRPGDEVITVANTAIPTATAICAAGGVPVFCDVDPGTWLLDPGRIGECVTERTRAIVPVHLYGAPCDMDRVLEAAARFRLAVIEDTAQATGSEYRGRKCGTIGDFGAFSFYPSKNLGANGDGGAVFVRTGEKRDLLRKLRNYGQGSRYCADAPGGENSRLDEIQAAILSVKLRHLDRWNAKRRELAEYYRTRLMKRNFPVHAQVEVDGSGTARHLFVVQVDPSRRDFTIRSMEERGAQALIHYPHPLYEQPAFRLYKTRPNEVSERLCASVLSLPFHQYLDSADIDHVVDCMQVSLG